jgi:hypothetical protein
MPLHARHHRGTSVEKLNSMSTDRGEAIPYRWGWFHLSAIYQVTERQGTRETLRSTGYATITADIDVVDPDDGEVMQFRIGDVVEMFG